MSDDGLVGPATAGARRVALQNARMSRRWSAARETIFFAELAETANVTHAATQAGMSPFSAYARRQRNAAFAARWMRALEAGYARLEMLLLDQALNGFDRTETVTDAEGAVKQVKTVRSFPHGVATRLLESHREAVERYRAMAAGQDADEEQRVLRIRAELARVRARLLEADGSPLIEGGGRRDGD